MKDLQTYILKNEEGGGTSAQAGSGYNFHIMHTYPASQVNGITFPIEQEG